MGFFLSPSVYKVLIPVFVVLKIIGFFYFALLLNDQIFGGGSDANYYHAYAIGHADFAVNFWPVIMRFFNDIGLYNRDIWRLLLFIISILILPILFLKIIKDRCYQVKPVSPAAFFIILFYPTIFFFAIDVFRDVFMCLVFLFAVLIIRFYFESKQVVGFFLLISFLCLCYFLFLLRPYLGASLLLSFFSYLLYARFSSYVKTWLFIYIIILMVVKASGVLNEVLEYRGVDGFVDGGTTLGIGLLNKDPVSFVIFYIYSFIAQVFGLYIVNFNSLLVFVFESIPFIFALVYVFKNIKFITKFGKLLVVFFIIYTTIWVMGNDNLGTAVRLRVPSYLVIFACMLIIYQEKAKYLYFKARQSIKS